MNNKAKYIIGGIIGVGCFIGFFGGTYHLMKSKSNDNVVMVGDTVTSEGKVMEFSYQNHKFINIVKASPDGKQESFVVHDPNCRCTVKKLNNITTVITNTDNHNTAKSDSISKANFRVILSKLNALDNDNAALMKEVKTLRVEVAMLKKMHQPVKYKVVPKKVIPKKKR